MWSCLYCIMFKSPCSWKQKFSMLSSSFCGHSIYYRTYVVICLFPVCRQNDPQRPWKSRILILMMTALQMFSWLCISTPECVCHPFQTWMLSWLVFGNLMEFRVTMKNLQAWPWGTFYIGLIEIGKASNSSCWCPRLDKKEGAALPLSASWQGTRLAATSGSCPCAFQTTVGPTLKLWTKT